MLPADAKTTTIKKRTATTTADTKPTQNNNNSPHALVRAKIHGHGHVRIYPRLGHINRTMQEPELPSD
jgi:hypothetical protein